MLHDVLNLHDLRRQTQGHAGTGHHSHEVLRDHLSHFLKILAGNTKLLKAIERK